MPFQIRHGRKVNVTPTSWE